MRIAHGQIRVRLQMDQQLLRRPKPLAAIIPSVHPVADIGTDRSCRSTRARSGRRRRGRRRVQAGNRTPRRVHLVGLQKLEVAGRQAGGTAEAGHVGAVGGRGAGGVATVRVAAEAGVRAAPWRRITGQAGRTEGRV